MLKGDERLVVGVFLQFLSLILVVSPAEPVAPGIHLMVLEEEASTAPANTNARN